MSQKHAAPNSLSNLAIDLAARTGMSLENAQKVVLAAANRARARAGAVRPLAPSTRTPMPPSATVPMPNGARGGAFQPGGSAHIAALAKQIRESDLGGQRDPREDRRTLPDVTAYQAVNATAKGPSQAEAAMKLSESTGRDLESCMYEISRAYARARRGGR